MQTNKRKFHIGIDPGSVVTGVAIWDCESKKMIFMHGYKSHCETILQLNAWIKNVGVEKVRIRIEDARRVRHLPVHVARKLNKGYDIRQGAGYVKALSKDWEEFAKLTKVEYELVSPHANQTKTTPEYFKKLTGLQTTKTQHHLRDAAMLVFGQ